jgi:hypothetical protein
MYPKTITKFLTLLMLWLGGIGLTVAGNLPPGKAPTTAKALMALAPTVTSIATNPAAPLCSGQTITATANISGQYSNLVFSVVDNFGVPIPVTSTNIAAGTATFTLPNFASQGSIKITASATNASNETGSFTTPAIIVNVAAAAFTLNNPTACTATAFSLSAVTGAAGLVFTSVSGPFNGVANSTSPPAANVTFTGNTQVDFASTAQAATGSYVVSATNVNGCPVSATATVTINNPVVQSILPTALTVCSSASPSSITLTPATSTSNVFTSLFFVGTTTTPAAPVAVASASGSTATFTPGVNAPAGSYVYRVQYQDATGCISPLSSASFVLTVVALPTISNVAFTSPAVCAGLSQSATITASGAISYSLIVGGVTTVSSSSVITFTTPSATSAYTVVVANSTGCRSVNSTGSLAVPAAVTAGIAQAPVAAGSFTVVSSLTACQGSVLFLQSSDGALPGSPANGPNTYSLLAFGLDAVTTGTLSSTSSPVSFTANQSGVISTTVVSTAGCVSIARIPVTVQPRPVPQVVAPPICQGQVATFTVNPFVQGTASVSAVIGQRNNATSAAIDPFGPTSITGTGPYNFTASTSAGGTGVGSFTVVDSFGCSAVVSGTVLVTAPPALPVVAFTSPAVCAGLSQSATVTSAGAVSYSLIVGGATTVSSSSVIAFTTPSATSAYTVVVANSAGCTTATVGSLTVPPGVTAGIAQGGVVKNSLTVCAGTVVTLLANDNSAVNTANPIGASSPYSGTYSAPGNMVSPATFATAATQAASATNFTALTSGVVTLRLANTSGCISTTTLNVTVNALPVPNITVAPSQTVCLGQVVTFNVTAGVQGGASVSAVIGQRNNATSQALDPFGPTSITGTGPYSFTASTSGIGTGVGSFTTIDSFGCVSAPKTQTVLVNGLPAIDGLAATMNPICFASQPVTLTATVALQTQIPGPAFVAATGATVDFFLNDVLASTTTVSGATVSATAIAAPGTYTITARISLNGCSTTAVSTPANTLTVVQTPNMPTVAANLAVCAGSGSLTASCATGGVVFVSSGGNTNPPGSTTALNLSGLPASATPYSYTVYCVGAGPASCTSSPAFSSVTVTGQPAINAVGVTANQICFASQPVNFTANTFGGVTTNRNTQFFVSTGGVTTLAASTTAFVNTGGLQIPASVTTLSVGVYSLTGVVTSEGCSASFTSPTASFTVVANPGAPTNLSLGSTAVTAGSTVSICQGTVASLTASCATGTLNSRVIAGGGAPTTQSGGGLNFFANSPAGVYSATLTCVGTAQPGCPSTPVAVTVVVNSNPVIPQIARSGNNLCSGTPFSLTASPTVAGPGSTTGLTFAWSGTGITSATNMASISAVYNNTTLGDVTLPYTVTVTSADGCSTTAMRGVTINPAVTANLITTSAICAGDFGQASYTLAGGSGYSATYSVTANGTGLTAVATSPQNVPATVNNANAFSASSSSTGGTGLFSVTFTATNTGCTVVKTGSVVVNPLPSTGQVITYTAAPLDNQGRPTYCSGDAGGKIILVAPAAASYSWTGPGITTPVRTQSLVVPAQPNTLTPTYVVSLTSATTPACPGTLSLQIKLNELPQGPTVNSTNVAICENPTTVAPTAVQQSINITGCSTGIAKLYLPDGTTVGNGMNSVLSYPIPTSLAAGTYVYMAVCKSQTNPTLCESTPVNVTVTVSPRPTATLSAPAGACVGQTITLNATTNGTALLFSNSVGAAGPSASTQVLFSNTNGASYSVTASNAANCQLTTGVSVSTNPALAVTVPPVAICAGQNASLTATATGGSGFMYSFNNGPATSSNVFTVTTPVNTATYPFSATNATGCTTAGSVQVTVNALPTPSIIGSTVICAGQSTVLSSNQGAGTSIVWSTGAVTPTITVSTAGVVSLTATNTSTGCSAVASVTVVVNALPVITVTASKTVACPQETVQLTASGGGSFYQWSNTQNTAPQIFVTSGTYSVTGMNANGCAGTATITIAPGTVPTATITPASPVVCPGQSTTLTAAGGTRFAWSPGGQTTASIVVSPTQATQYGVMVTNADGCSATASTVVNIAPSPQISIAGNSPICVGGTATLVASGASSFTWSTGATTASIPVSPTATTTYSVTGSNGAGCPGVATAMVTVNPLPTAAISGNLTICAGQSTVLTASGGTSYQFSNGVGGRRQRLAQRRRLLTR